MIRRVAQVHLLLEHPKLAFQDGVRRLVLPPEALRRRAQSLDHCQGTRTDAPHLELRTRDRATRGTGGMRTRTLTTCITSGRRQVTWRKHLAMQAGGWCNDPA